MTNKKTFDQLQETIYNEQLDNGLTVYVLPKPDFHKTFAVFSTNYGSIDNHFVPIGKKEAVTVSDGIAHFLEHKMFEDEQGDVFQTFGEQGASANAFTSFTKTAYLFSSTQDTDKNLETLLDFVQHPYFTDETVEKEKGIIEQEITMYEDNPDWQLFFNLLGSMYHKHPVKIDIAGSADSIYEITKEDLYECYETFYHPSNMILFVAGDVQTDQIIELVRNNQNNKSFKEPEEIERIFDGEPKEVKNDKSVAKMSVNTPKCMVGYKVNASKLEGKELLKYEFSMQLMLDALFGPGSDAYEALYEDGLIDDSFSTEFTAERSFSFLAVGGDTKEPDKLEERIIQTIDNARDKGLSEDQLERVRKKKIGNFLKQLNSLEFVANQYTSFAFHNIHLFEAIPVLEEITIDEINQMLETHFEESTRSVSQIIQKQAN
ncbi:EF-P 5-aminopentanol modification-associated protein YfmH [Alteribacillus bidgolensis]|uniref:Predicted Zn-dependent peptidase n=1 Tax=Alteribacillus bidgolensis TaxID=930129 RepID=A0A1G8DB57_9BACI|nr:pitrilysin family protein [Alteribacillus bidgolensis]SDH54915.1 Predicted Zn-dependent peptidase [Alteribacillus bidgolensis]